jgi:hypothetical protein
MTIPTEPVGSIPRQQKVIRGVNNRPQGVLPTVVSSGAIWTEIEPGFHIELEAPVRINVLPD